MLKVNSYTIGVLAFNKELEEKFTDGKKSKQVIENQTKCVLRDLEREHRDVGIFRDIFKCQQHYIWNLTHPLIIQRHFRSHSECSAPVQQAIARYFSFATDSHDRRPVSKQPRHARLSCQTARWLDDVPDSRPAYDDHGGES